MVVDSTGDKKTDDSYSKLGLNIYNFSDEILTNYPNIKKYSNEPASGIKDWQPVEGHALSYYYTMDFAKGNIKHIGHEFDDWVLIRRIPSYRGRRCSDTIINEYLECIEYLKEQGYEDGE